jgi:hypothetical protein
MSELRIGQQELLELDIDVRVMDLMCQMANMAIVTSDDAKCLVIESHRRAAEDVLNDNHPERFYINRGYKIPHGVHSLTAPAPLAWLGQDYIPEDDKIIGYYEYAWERTIGDESPDDMAAYMRAAYCASHTIAYLKKRKII